MERNSKENIELVHIDVERDLYDILIRCRTILRKDKEDASLNDALRYKLTGTYNLFFKNRGGIESEYEEPKPIPSNTRIRTKPSLVLDPEIEARVKPIPNDTVTHTPPDREEMLATDTDEMPPEGEYFGEEREENGTDKDNPDRFFIPKQVKKEEKKTIENEPIEAPPPIYGIFIPAPPIPQDIKPKIKPRYKLRDEK